MGGQYHENKEPDSEKNRNTVSAAGDSGRDDARGDKFVGWKCGSRTYAPGELIYVNGNMSFTAVWRDFNVTVIIRYFDIDPLNYPHKKEYRMTDTGTSHGYETVGQYFSRMHVCFTPEYSIEYNSYQTINDDRTIYVWDWGTGPETDMSLYR